MIQAVLLDVDNTLLDFDKCAAVAVDLAARQLGLTLPEDFMEVFDRVNHILWPEKDAGRLTLAELKQRRFSRIFAETGVSFDGMIFEEEFMNQINRTVIPVEGALPLLEYLHGNYIVCAASNAGYEQQLQRLRQAGMYRYIDHLFVSERLGAEKPQPMFFRGCLDRLQLLRPSEIIMIGDTLIADIEGAAAAGLWTCWYNYYHQPVPEKKPADYVVERLSDIRSFL